jgi:hypothetical protein
MRFSAGARHSARQLGIPDTAYPRFYPPLRNVTEAAELAVLAVQKIQEVDEIGEGVIAGCSLRAELHHAIGAVRRTRVSPNVLDPYLPTPPESSVPHPIGASLNPKLHPLPLGMFAEQGFKVSRRSCGTAHRYRFGYQSEPSQNNVRACGPPRATAPGTNSGTNLSASERNSEQEGVPEDA